MTARELIRNSAESGEIVTHRLCGEDGEYDMLETLEVESDDSAKNGGVIEYWGSGKTWGFDGDWRVHILGIDSE